MIRNKIFRQVFAVLFIVAIVFCNAVSQAEIKTYEGHGVYYIVGDETIDFAKEKAALLAERDAIEQVKLYIKSNSRVVNSKLLEDEIITIAAGILRVIDTKHAIEVEDDALIVKAFVTAIIDTDELENLLDNAVKNR